MKKLYLLALAAFFSVNVSVSMAAPADESLPTKKPREVVVPDSTRNSNYLEPQPNEKGTATSSDPTQATDQKSKKSFKKNDKPGNTKKSRNQFIHSPDNRGDKSSIVFVMAAFERGPVLN